MEHWVIKKQIAAKKANGYQTSYIIVHVLIFHGMYCQANSRLHPANEKQHYFVTMSVIDWVQA